MLTTLSKFERLVLLGTMIFWGIANLIIIHFFGSRGAYIWAAMALLVGYICGEYLRKRRKRLWAEYWRATHPGASDEFMPKNLGKND